MNLQVASATREVGKKGEGKVRRAQQVRDTPERKK